MKADAIKRYLCFGGLIAIAILSFVAMLIVVFVEPFQSNLRSEETSCLILNKTIEYHGDDNSRLMFWVMYAVRQEQNETSIAYWPSDGTYDTENKTAFYNTHECNDSYVCYFDPTHLTSVTLSLPHRTLVIVVLVIASACMVLIPITICISACLLRGRSGGVTLARVSEEERRRERVPILRADQD